METASEMLWALISTDMLERLLVERHWSRKRLADHLALLFRSTFVTDDGAAGEYQPRLVPGGDPSQPHRVRQI